MSDSSKTLQYGLGRTAYIAINGIRFRPGTAHGWPERFTEWVNTRLPDGVVADRREYYTTAVTRFIGQRKRTDELARKVRRYQSAGYRVVLVGHSNGADVIARLLRDVGLWIDAVHLFAPAALEEDFEDALINSTVGKIHIYGSVNDKALQWGKVTRVLLGWAGLGYGSMGTRGGEFAARFPGQVIDHSNHTFSHSTWFTEGQIFERTMHLITDNNIQDQKSTTP